MNALTVAWPVKKKFIHPVASKKLVVFSATSGNSRQSLNHCGMGSAIWTLSPESSGWTRAIASTNLASGAERLSVYITAGQSACPSLSRATYPANGPAAAIAFGLIPARPASHSPCSRRVPHCSVDCSKMSPCICESTSADQFHCFCPVRSNAVNRMLCVPRSMASKSALDMLSILFFEVP